MGGQSVEELIREYDPGLPLELARTIPASWYLDSRVLELEKRTVLANSWQMLGRAGQVADPGQFLSGEVAGEPVLAARGHDRLLRGFFNVCRHHAATVETRSCGIASHFRCPYHGWTYALDGALKGTPDFTGVGDFLHADHGLVPLETALWELWVFVKTSASAAAPFPWADVSDPIRSLKLARYQWKERRHYHLNCNWKVFVDNYLDGGYHVPLVHKGLSSVLDYSNYTIEVGSRHCLQSSPIQAEKGEKETALVRQGGRALYYWFYPNFMVNWYEGALDTNLVIPRGVDRTEVIFDFYFSGDNSSAESMAVADCIQQEDVGVCESVQRGLASRSYRTGRLSVRREAGEHLFHKLLYGDLLAGLKLD